MVSSSSNDLGGVNMAFLDVSVRSLKARIDLVMYEAPGLEAGGEIIDASRC